MGDYTNRYYGGINKECQIRSNTFHSHANAHHVSIDTKKLEEQETLSSASSTAAQTATTAATTTTTAAASSTAAVSTSAAVAGGTAAAVATATVVVVASAIFVPSVNEFKYESTANTLSYSFELNYKNADSAVVVLENRLEKYEQFFELESYFPEEEMADNDEGFFVFEEGRFTDLTPSTTYRLSVSVIDGDNTYDVFSERVKTNDTPDYSAPVTYVTFNFYNDDGTVLWDTQTIPYGEQVFYAGETNLDEEADRRSSDTKTYFLGWASSVGGEPYDGEMYAFEDRDYYAVFGEKIYTVTIYDGDYTILQVEVPYGETFCIDESQAGGYDFWREPDENGCYSFDHYEDINGNIIFGYDEITITDNLEIYATYIVTAESVHTVFLDYDGTILQDNYQMAYYGIYYDYSLPTREGTTADDPKYIFLGWTCEEMDKLITNNEMYELDASSYGGQTLTFTATYVEGEYTVTFLNEDGSEVLATQYAYSGDEVYYPYDDPQKEPTETIQYIFVGWDTVPNGTHGLHEFPSVTEDAWYYACFIEEERLYTVTFYDGQSAMYYSSTTYGETWSIDGSDVGSEDFWKEPDANGCYELDHFEDANGNTIESAQEFTIYEDMDIYMIFTIYAESVHTVFYNWDGTLLQDEYQEATTGIYYSGDTPEAPEPEEEGGIMEFYGWHCAETDTDIYFEDMYEFDASDYAGGTLTFTAIFNEMH